MASVLQQQQLQQQQQQLLNQNQQQQTVSTTEVAGGEFTETRSVQLEWKITGLKQLFESTKGDNKSKCIKSALFDSSRWQVYLYMNSGVEQYLSLYLSCEPTAAEREKGLEAEKALWPLKAKNSASGSASNRNSVVGSSKNASAGKGSWRREGKFKFSFEARSLDGKLTFKTMEAENHVFNESQKNWGYSTFIKRSDAFYSNPSVRLSDGMQIVCTIVSSATNPTPAELPRLLIPKDLVASFSSLFDDPDYSDVCFIIRSEPQEDDRRKKKISERRIYAAKKILAGRSEYFATMFNSGFYESTAVPPSPVAVTTSSSTDTPIPPSQSQSHSRASSNNSSSDDSDSNDEWDEDDDSDLDEEEEELDAYEEAELSDTASTHATFYAASTSSRQVPSSAGASDDEKDKIEEEESDGVELRRGSIEAGQGDDSLILEAVSNASISLAEKRRTVESDSFVDAVGDFTTRRLANKKKVKKPTKMGARATDRRPRAEVVVTDAAYTSFRALIYYLYTDSITFAPLSSTYTVAKEAAQLTNSPFPFANRRAYLKQKNSDLQLPQPCSSKAIYRLADKIGLPELKEKASEFIFKNLTAQNIVFEVFGSFSLRFEEVKRVQIAFLLERWNEVRSSSSMRRVFEQIRSGSHPGFEDVFLAILNNLEYKPEVAF